MENRRFQNSKQRYGSWRGEQNTAYGKQKEVSGGNGVRSVAQGDSSRESRPESQGSAPAASKNQIKTVRELLIWQKGLSLVKEIYYITKAYPREELYGLVAQMKRCAVSVPSNIAEGFRRRHSKEFKQFLNVGLGSLAELETQLIISSELAFVEKNVASTLLEKIDYLTAMMICLSKKM